MPAPIGDRCRVDLHRDLIVGRLSRSWPVASATITPIDSSRERDRVSSDLDDVSVIQCWSTNDLFTVDERTVAATHVGDRPSVAGKADSGVTATGLVAADHDLIGRGTADECLGGGREPEHVTPSPRALQHQIRPRNGRFYRIARSCRLLLAEFESGYWKSGYSR